MLNTLLIAAQACKRSITLALLFCFFTTCIQAQKRTKTPEEKQLLKEAVKIFSEGRFDEAAPMFQKLFSYDSTNANYNFALGISYLYGSGDRNRSIQHLQITSRDSSSELHLYVNYFLGEAYVKAKKCDEAKAAFEKYKSSLKASDPKIKDVDALLASCTPTSDVSVKADTTLSSLIDSARVSPLEAVAPVAVVDTAIKTVSVEAPVTASDTKSKKTEESVTENKPAPDRKFPKEFWAVQMGIFKKSVTDDYFKNINDLYKIEGEQSLKYYSGVFKNKEAARPLLKEIKEKGYQDAFIVKVNSKMQFKPATSSTVTEPIAGTESNTNSTGTGKNYTIQLGAYKTTVPIKTAVQFMRVQGIRVDRSADGSLLCQVGAFNDKAEAEKARKDMLNKGFKNAKVVEIAAK